MSHLRLPVCLLLMFVASPACLVIGLNHFYDETALTFDERLLGTWTDADDGVTATVERGEWRSYKVTYVHPIERGSVTGYLFTAHGELFLDLMPLRGEDHGSFLAPGHIVARVSLAEGTLTLTPLSYDWFARSLKGGGVPAALKAAAGERGQIVLSGPVAALSRWLAARGPADPAFGAAATFVRQ